MLRCHVRQKLAPVQLNQAALVPMTAAVRHLWPCTNAARCSQLTLQSWRQFLLSHALPLLMLEKGHFPAVDTQHTLNRVQLAFHNGAMAIHATEIWHECTSGRQQSVAVRGKRLTSDVPDKGPICKASARECCICCICFPELSAGDCAALLSSVGLIRSPGNLGGAECTSGSASRADTASSRNSVPPPFPEGFAPMKASPLIKVGKSSESQNSSEIDASSPASIESISESRYGSSGAGGSNGVPSFGCTNLSCLVLSVMPDCSFPLLFKPLRSL